MDDDEGDSNDDYDDDDLAVCHVIQSFGDSQMEQKSTDTDVGNAHLLDSYDEENSNVSPCLASSNITNWPQNQME